MALISFRGTPVTGNSIVRGRSPKRKQDQVRANSLTSASCFDPCVELLAATYHHDVSCSLSQNSHEQLALCSHHVGGRLLNQFLANNGRKADRSALWLMALAHLCPNACPGSRAIWRCSSSRRHIVLGRKSARRARPICDRPPHS